MKNTLQFKRGWLDRLVRWLTWWLKEMWRDLKAPRWPEGAIVEVLLVIWTLPLCGAWLVYWVISRPLACAINLRRHRSVAAWLYGKPEPTMPPNEKGEPR